MGNQLTEELVWIDECFAFEGAPPEHAHKHVSVYLLSGDTNVLIDSGSFLHRDDISREVGTAIGDGNLDALVLSHSDYPHAANVESFVDIHGAELIASSGAPKAQGLPDATKCDIGGSMTVAGRECSFIDPPLADRSHTTWIFDHATSTLFTADGFGSRHSADRCEFTSRDYGDGIPAAAIESFHANELPWLRYVDPDRLREAIEAIFAEFPPAWVAPVHGHPIAGEDLSDYVDRLIAAADRITSEYRSNHFPDSGGTSKT